jgi:hypothetical protein
VVLVVPEPDEPLGGAQKLPHPAKKGVKASNNRAHFLSFIVTPGSTPDQGPTGNR